MRISDWSSDVCSSDLVAGAGSKLHRFERTGINLHEARIGIHILFVEVVQGTGQRPRRPEIENLVDAPFIPQVINTAHIAEGLIGWRRKPQFLRKQFVRLGYLEGVHARRGKIEIVAKVILPVHISRLRTQREIAELISGYERSEENTLNSSH